MVNRPKQIGTAAETVLVRHARTHGFGGAERLALHGTHDEGDATLCPGVGAQVKGGKYAEQASDALITRWLAEAETQRLARRCDVMLLVLKRARKGPKSAGQWWVHIPGRTFIDLGCVGNVPSAWSLPGLPAVTITLDQALDLLRQAGYGHPTRGGDVVTGHTQLPTTPAGDRWDSDWHARCTCGWTKLIPATAKAVRAAAAHAAHAEDAAVRLAAVHRDFYRRTGSCGLCGQPGTYCVCVGSDPCGCSLAGLHPLGSGLKPDALDQFRDTVVEQDGLF